MGFNPTEFKGLFFDIYATLIDWEAGIYPQLLHLSQKLPSGDARRDDNAENRKKLLRAYASNEKAVEHEHPRWPYPQILEEVYSRIASDLGVPIDSEDKVAFGRSIGDWPAFPDTVKAMQVLAKHYKLFVLSNVDNASFDRTRTGPLKGVHWDGIYTAEQIGSYKPNPNNYNHVVTRLDEDFGIEKDKILLVAQSLDIDHVSAKALGFKPAVWIARNRSFMGGNREELESKGLIELGAEFSTLGEMAEAVEKAFSGRE
jgi:2-haloalkanoic acid dehalogenase type II